MPVLFLCPIRGVDFPSGYLELGHFGHRHPAVIVLTRQCQITWTAKGQRGGSRSTVASGSFYLSVWQTTL
jgi:hypothetical protein